MKKICNVHLSNQISITLLVCSVVASFFAMINSSVSTTAFKLIALLAFISVFAFTSTKEKQIPNIILIFAVALRVIISIVEFMSFKQYCPEILFHDIIGIIIGAGIVMLVNKFSPNFFTLNELKLFAIMGMFCGYKCTYITLMLALIFGFIIKKYMSSQTRKNINLSFEPLVLCGYIIAMIMYKS